MKILSITPYLPSEKSGHAGPQLIFRNLKVLTRDHSITLVTFINKNELADLSDLKELGIKVYTVQYERNRGGFLGVIISVFQNIVPLVRSLIGMDIFFIAKYKKRKMKLALNKVLRNFNPDIVQVDYNVMHHYTELFSDIPKILIQHDISTKVFERGSLNAETWLGRKNHFRLYNLANKYEPDLMREFDRIITLTEEDKYYCESRWKNIPLIEVIPPQIHVKDIHVEKNRHEICFVGSFNREPNLQALNILVDEILPKLFKKYPDIKLKIAGRHLPQKMIEKLLGITYITYYGFVDDIDAFIGQSVLFVAPIKIGAGLKMKILHALACGTPVVTTPIGAEGISLGIEEGLWIEKATDSITYRCIDLLKYHGKLIEAGQKGKTKVMKIFSPELILRKFNVLYQGLVRT